MFDLIESREIFQWWTHWIINFLMEKMENKFFKFIYIWWEYSINILPFFYLELNSDLLHDNKNTFEWNFKIKQVKKPEAFLCCFFIFSDLYRISPAGASILCFFLESFLEILRLFLVFLYFFDFLVQFWSPERKALYDYFFIKYINCFTIDVVQ